MKKIFFGLIVLFCACQRFEPFTFVQMSDPQIGFLDDSPAYIQSGALFKAAVEEVNAIDPLCVVITAGSVGNALGHGKPGYNVVNVTDTGINSCFTPTLADN